MGTAVVEASAGVRESLRGVSRGLVEREILVELVALAAVADEHLLVVGPPGTAKSEAVRRVARALGGRYFEYLLGRFTEPSELFGPVDLRKLKEGRVETETAGMLPEAELAFLDEVFLGSTAILNTLLVLLNERTFRRGHTEVRSPLRVCVGSSNAIPEDETLAAFADRFLLRLFVEPVADSQLEVLLEGGWSLQSAGAPVTASLAQLDLLRQTARQADLGPLRPALAQAIRTLRAAGVTLTDRRVVKVQRLIAAAGALAGREQPTEADLWPLLYAIPTAEAQTQAREVLRSLLARSESATLSAAAEDASHGPLARAHRLAALGNEVFAARPSEAASLAAWRLKVEGVARELDAGFAEEQLTPELKALRARIVDELKP